MMSRRAFLGAAAVSPVWWREGSPENPPGYVVGVNGARLPQVELVREWNGAVCRSRIVNRGPSAVSVKEVVLGEFPIDLPPTTALYGEGFQMLTETGGTIAEPVDLSQYTDAKHYRIPTSGGARAFYGLVTVSPPVGDARVFAFTSCARFSGRFQFRGSSLQAIVDCEGLSVPRAQACPLEEFMVASGSDRSALLADLARRLSENHRPLKAPTRSGRTIPPTGWCSWYCFGPNVTARQVLDNLDAIAKTMPSLRYIQIDDGYQRAMGDWLEGGALFGGSVRAVLSEIKRRGFEPAIWVAPFIAEEQSDSLDLPPRSARLLKAAW